MRFFKAIALAACLLPQLAVAQTGATPAEKEENSILETRAADVVTLIMGELEPEEILADSFLAAVPAAQFKQVTAGLTAQFGDVVGVESVEPTGVTTAKIALRFERAIGSGTMSVERTAPQKINGLLLQSFEPIGDSIEKIKADLEALPGDVGAYYGPLDGEAPVLSMNPDRQFAIGSTFKLYVLSALAREIAAGKRQWDDVVVLDRTSFPSGIAQTWPSGSPVTLHTLATLMISISDNTATDQLIHVLGRDAVEAELRASGHSNPDRTLPFLTTLEMFALKSSPDNQAKFVAGDEETKRFILADFEDDIGGNASLIEASPYTEPKAIDTLEWFASANDLRGLFQRMNGHDDEAAAAIMAVNTSMPDNLREKWDYVGYKGGSEPGVLNLTWLMTDNTGSDHILTLSWNNTDAALDNTALELIAQRILSLPR